MKISITFITTIFICLSLVVTSSIPPNCNKQNPPTECLLFLQYKDLNEQLACQLCAVALQSGKYKQKTQYFCTENVDGKLRNCGLTSMAYSLIQGHILQAFDLQYDNFFIQPFKHSQKVSNLLKKQNIRSSLINWLQIHMDNTQPDYLLEKAIAQYYLDDDIESQNQIKNYLKQYQENQITVKLRCRIYEKQGQFNQGLNFLSKYISQIGKKGQQNVHPYLYHLMGNFYMHHLRFDKAIMEFQRANRAFKQIKKRQFMHGFKFSSYNIGVCYLKMSKFEQAAKIFSNMVTLQYKDTQVLNALGNSYIQWASKSQKIYQTKIKKGIFYLSKAIQTDQDYYIAYFNLGSAYLKINQFKKAIQNFIKSLQIKTSSQTQYGLLSAYFKSNSLKQAENLINSNLTVNSQTIDEILSIFYTDFCQNDGWTKDAKFYDRVLKKYEELIKSGDGNYWLAMIYFYRQNYGLAIDHFLKAYDLGYNQPYLLFNLGYSYQLLQDYSQAVHYYEKAYKKDPRQETKQNIEQCKSKIKEKQGKDNKEQEL